MDWLAQAIRNTWSSQVKTPMDIRGWRAIEEGQALLRELGMRKKIYDARFTGSDKDCIHQRFKELDSARTLRLE